MIELHLYGRKGKICCNTFKEYRPNFVEQTGVLTQFACDNCTEFNYVNTGLRVNTKYIHDCQTTQCRNYQYPMGDHCTCTNCRKCMIIKYGNMSSHQLLRELCTCGTKPELLCAEGRCLKPRNCGVQQYRVLLLYGRGCHSFKRNIDRDIEFKRVMKHEVDGKEYKFVKSDSFISDLIPIE